MKKRYVIPVIGAVASAGVGYLMIRKGKSEEETTLLDTLANAGMPDQLSNEKQEQDQLENAKMVSEGSQFGVQYFNKAVEDDMEELEERMKN